MSIDINSNVMLDIHSVGYGYFTAGITESKALNLF